MKRRWIVLAAMLAIGWPWINYVSAEFDDFVLASAVGDVETRRTPGVKGTWEWNVANLVGHGVNVRIVGVSCHCVDAVLTSSFISAFGSTTVKASTLMPSYGGVEHWVIIEASLFELRQLIKLPVAGVVAIENGVDAAPRNLSLSGDTSHGFAGTINVCVRGPAVEELVGRDVVGTLVASAWGVEVVVAGTWKSTGQTATTDLSVRASSRPIGGNCDLVIRTAADTHRKATVTLLFPP